MRQKVGAKALVGFLMLVSFATVAEARKVQMAVATFSQSVLPMVVAQEKGYFREDDLDVELILMTAAVANMALLGGNVDFISSGPSVISAIARGAPLKFVFICFNRPMHWLYAKPENKRRQRAQGKEDRRQRAWRQHPFSRSRDPKKVRAGQRSRCHHSRCGNYGEPLRGFTKRHH